MKTEKIILTVTQLNSLLKSLVEEAFREIYVEGEISNLKFYSSGHLYFSLKDQNSQIQCVIFRDVLKRIKFKLENGLKVLCYGRVSIYLTRGEYQFIVYDISPKGIGALQLAFEQLKKKLELEGLFDPARKKPIPILPQYIGVVTSPDGAAIRDILTVIKRRFANVEILIYPVKVQGEGAKEEIAEGIRYLNEHFKYLDVLLIGRGGGSIEDLWAFNEEIVARAIVESKIPTISCVGHEIDYTIADYVADLRAPTPSAAAELVVKNKEELKHKISIYRKMLVQYLKQRYISYLTRFQSVVSSRVLTVPQTFFEDKIQKVAELQQRMFTMIKYFLQTKIHALTLLKEKLNLLSPENILSRGYSIVWYKGKIVKDTAELKKNDIVKIQLYKGKFNSIVTEIE